MSKTTNKFSPEIRERAVRMLVEHEGEHPSRWAAVVSIAEKIGCSAHTLLEWVRKAEVDSGKRAGAPADGAEKLKALERENRELRQAIEILRKASAYFAQAELRDFPVPGGRELRCKGWRQEGLLRLLENVLAVGEAPERLVVYAALGKAARDWPSHDAIVTALKTMEEDETLVVQSGKPIGILRTHVSAPLVIMANCNLVGRWATAENFYRLEEAGLICWGGLTAGDWQYIGSQGVIQGTYEILMRIAERHFGGDLAGKFVLTAGLGGMGGAQPLAGRMAGASTAVWREQRQQKPRPAARDCRGDDRQCLRMV